MFPIILACIVAGTTILTALHQYNEKVAAENKSEENEAEAKKNLEKADSITKELIQSQNKLISSQTELNKSQKDIIDQQKETNVLALKLDDANSKILSLSNKLFYSLDDNIVLEIKLSFDIPQLAQIIKDKKEFENFRLEIDKNVSVFSELQKIFDGVTLNLSFVKNSWAKEIIAKNQEEYALDFQPFLILENKSTLNFFVDWMTIYSESENPGKMKSSSFLSYFDGKNFVFEGNNIPLKITKKANDCSILDLDGQCAILKLNIPSGSSLYQFNSKISFSVNFSSKMFGSSAHEVSAYVKRGWEIKYAAPFSLLQ